MLEKKKLSEDEISTLISSMKEQASQIPDEQFPKFIFAPAYHEFEDSAMYWSDYDNSDPRLRVLETLPKVKNIWKYFEYKHLWEEYVADVADKHGLTPELIVEMFRLGAIEEYIPDPPQLQKKNKQIKQILKTGIMPQIQSGSGLLETMKEIVDNKATLKNSPNEIPTYTSIDLPDKDQRAQLHIAETRLQGEYRQKNLFRAADDIRGTSILSDYFGNWQNNIITSTKQDGSEYIKDNGYVDYDKLIKDSFHNDNVPDWLRKSESEKNGLVIPKWEGGRYRSEQQVREDTVIKALIAAGINPMKVYGKGRMSKSQILLSKEQFSDPQNMTKKEFKKWKKKKKKSEAISRKHMSNLGGIGTLLTGNGYTVDDIMSFGTEDRFRDEY